MPEKVRDGFGVQPGPEGIDCGGVPEIVEPVVRTIFAKCDPDRVLTIMITEVIAKH